MVSLHSIRIGHRLSSFIAGPAWHGRQIFLDALIFS
jgi:hypothetical protein